LVSARGLGGTRVSGAAGARRARAAVLAVLRLPGARRRLAGGRLGSA